MAQLIDGIKVAKEIKDDIKKKISFIEGRKPCLAVVIVGEDPASQLYVKRKIEACKEVGITSVCQEFDATISQEKLMKAVDALNKDASVDGILVQMPLPSSIDPHVIIQQIDPHKDVDGFHPMNVGKLLAGQEDAFVPCTPLGVKTLLDHYKVPIEGKHVVIVGRSNIVGKPMAALLVQRKPGHNATVTITHRHTKNLPEVCLQADILIVAVGMPGYITADCVKEGATVIDVGMNALESEGKRRKVVGDVDFENVKEKCTWITPVPGGVGPMTIAMLLQNTFVAYSS